MNPPLRSRRGLWPLWLGLLVMPGAPAAAGTSADEPEDSPLYAASRRETYITMGLRDQGAAAAEQVGSGGLPEPGKIILIEGTQWFAGPAIERRLGPGKAPAGSGPAKPRPTPADVTTDISCLWPTMCTTCEPTTCGATCDASPTCRAYPSCHVPGPTCIYQTCDGSSTCNPGQATCAGVSCTQPGLTCTPPGTCTPASCPTHLFDVRVPQAGQLQLSFYSSPQLKYVLQYCTNLTAVSWAEACTTNGTGALVTLCHTNLAPTSLYRLLLQPL